jgi:hypothetical protein
MIPPHRSRPGLEGTRKDFVSSAMARSLGSWQEGWDPWVVLKHERLLIER